jgi:phosphohistidine phosphatase SixA
LYSVATSRRRRYHTSVRALLLACLLALPTPAARADADADADAVLRALRDGQVAILLRHTQTTPGAGDPSGWRPDRCATQRNLNAEGRAHARRIGAWFQRHRITPTTVRTSPWCRTRDTARLAFGAADDWAALANLYEDRSPEQQNAAEVRRYVATLRAGDVAVLVSHGITILAIAGAHPAPGEGIVVRAAPRPGGDGEPRLIIVGRLVVP